MKPIRIQVAFQGGGARIFGHLAVCEVLQEFNSERPDQPRRIEITRVAGSSAGALAAAALSSAEAVSTLKERFAQAGEDLRTSFNEEGMSGRLKRARGLYRVVRGKAYFGAINLASIFQRIYHPRDVTRTVKTLQPETFIYYSDVNTRRLRPAPPDDTVSQALADSCNFPFAFSGWQVGSARVDAGLTQNLPIDDLYEQQAEDGEVIAIAFRQESSEPGRLPVISHVQALFAAAIEASVSRSIRILGRKNVYEIQTDVRTFEFEKALTFGFGQPYDDIKKAFRHWLDGWVEERRDRTNWVKPINTVSTLPSAIIRQLTQDMSAAPLLALEDVTAIDLAIFHPNTGNFAGKYQTRFRATATLLRTAHVVKQRAGFVGEETVGEIQLRCAAYDADYRPFDLSIYVHRSNVKSGEFNVLEIYYCFNKPLQAGDRVVLEYEFVAPDCYPLIENGIEYSTLHAMHGEAKSMTLIVGFPKQKIRLNACLDDIAEAIESNKFKMKFTEAQLVIRSHKCQYADVAHLLHINSDAGKYYFAIRRAAPVPLGAAFGFVLDSRPD